MVEKMVGMTVVKWAPPMAASLVECLVELMGDK